MSSNIDYRITLMGYDENILFGGPEPPIIDDESKSFGEVILKRLKSHSETILFVCTGR